MANLAKPVEFLIFQDLETERFGYRVRFVGADNFHYSFRNYKTMEQAVRRADPGRERVWEKSPGDDVHNLLISRGYREGTLGWWMHQLQHKADERERASAKPPKLPGTIVKQQKVPKPRKVTLKQRVAEALAADPTQRLSLAESLGISLHSLACHSWRLKTERLAKFTECTQ